MCGNTLGGPWYIENLFPELDSPSEFYYDAPNQQLYLFWNATGAPPANVQFVATHLETLISVVGTQDAPAGIHRVVQLSCM